MAEGDRKITFRVDGSVSTAYSLTTVLIGDGMSVDRIPQREGAILLKVFGPASESYAAEIADAFSVTVLSDEAT